MGKVLLQNIGTLFTGDIDKPIMTENSILIEDGVIVKIDNNITPDDETLIIDTKQTTVLPGLMDCHVHVAISEWSPRQSAMAWLDAYVNSGITGVISAGESHVPNRPRDAEGVKALAILTHKIYQKMRPGGMKVYGGAIIPERGLTEKDFQDLAEIGIFHSGEFGLGGATDPVVAGQMAEWGKKHGVKTMCHTGATFLEGTTLMDTERILGINPDVICHLSGGGIPVDGMRRFVEETEAQVEACAVGRSNIKFNAALLDILRENNGLQRLMLGTDTPSGYGIFPHSVWEVMGMLCGLCNLEPEIAIACGSGNTSRFYGIKASMIKPGYSADLVICDAPVGAHTNNVYDSLKEGIMPGISIVMIDGQIIAEGDKVNTAPPRRRAMLHSGKVGVEEDE